ncbi:longitudinals lacking protein, isoforms H/M/V-like isoform X5 [Scylla paramamosain]
MQKKRSAVWRHFAEEGENKVSCRTCHKRLTKHGNTSMMLRHLRGKHPELMHCLLLDAEGPSGHEETWPMEEPQAEEVVESLPPIDASAVKKKRSTVWKYFEEEGTDKVSCRICDEKLAKHGNTSSMLRHLRGKHPQLKLGDLQGDQSKKMNHLHLCSSNTEMRFLSVCERLLLNNQLTDCTLVAEGQFVQAHRLVLATSSEVFEEMFKTVCQANPVVVLRDISLQELRGLISYMYKGETLVKSHDLPGLLKAAAQLKIKGLSQVGLSESWLDDSRNAAAGVASSPPHHHHHHHVNPKPDMTFYQDDQEMEEMDEDDPDHQGTGQEKKNAATINLMAMCEEVVLDEAGGGLVAEGDGRTLKRVQIKLEHGVGVPQEVPPSVDLPSHRSPDTFLAGSQEEAVIHHDAEEMQQQQQQQQQERQMRDDPLARAVKVTQSASGGDLEQGMPGILTTNGAVVRMGGTTPQQGASSVQNAIDNEGLILLGLAGTTENQGRVYAGPSHPKPDAHTRGASLRRLRRYSKQDLLTALNMIRDGHLGIKPAARAFNIPVATLYNATKRHDISSPMQQGANKDIWRNKGPLLVSTDGIHVQCLPPRSPTLPEAS